jgi:hypothetical protein
VQAQTACSSDKFISQYLGIGLSQYLARKSHCGYLECTIYAFGPNNSAPCKIEGGAGNMTVWPHFSSNKRMGNKVGMDVVRTCGQKERQLLGWPCNHASHTQELVLQSEQKMIWIDRHVHETTL